MNIALYIRIWSSFINRMILIGNQQNDLNWQSMRIILIDIKNDSLDWQSMKQSYWHWKQQWSISSTLMMTSEASQSMIDLIWQLTHDESVTLWQTSNERNFQWSTIIWMIASNTSELWEPATAHETAKCSAQWEDMKTMRWNTEQHDRSSHINIHLISHDSMFLTEIIRL